MFGVDDRRVGLIVRMLRRRRGWRQLDLAALSGCSQSFLSQLERGHLDRASLGSLRRIIGVLDARAEVEIRWRGGEVDRLLDARHAVLVGETVMQLRETRWMTAVEVTFARFGERGSIDLLAFRPDAAALLVVEVKSELTSLEETLRRLDQKVRLAPSIANERLGWVALGPTSRLLVLPETSTTRDRLRMHAAGLDSTLPVRGLRLRRWLEQPVGPVSGIRLVRNSNPGGDMRRGGGSHRIRASRGSGPRSV
jgi:transcriptional regulator with XRE-family HTH domain